MIAAFVAVPATASAAIDTVITVTTLNDDTSSNNGCSLREAITNFNDHAQTYSDCPAGLGNTLIQFSGSGTITLGSQLPDISDPNWELFIDGGFAPGGTAGITIDAQNCIQHEYAAPTCFRQFHVDAGAALSLQNLNLINGHAPDGEGGDGLGTDGENGGSILNEGWVDLANVDISHSQAGDGGAALNGSPGAGGNGGGIYNAGGATVHANGVTLDHSRAGESGINGSSNARPIAGRGGGIYNAGGYVDLTNATLAYNSVPFTLDAHRGGAGIYTDGGTVSVSFSTFADNTVQSTGGVGEGIYAIDSAAVNFQNTIMDDIPPNTSIWADCFTGFGGQSPETPGTISDRGYNLENGSSCGFTGGGSAQNIDPQLQGGAGSPVLQNNLGSNQTIALEPTSPAIDRIPYGASGCGGALTFDERGFDRPFPALGQCDVGAFESDPLPQAITFALPPIQASYGSTFNVNPTSDSGLPVSVTPTGPCTAKSASAGGYDITMTAGTGTCSLAATQAGSLLFQAAPEVDQTVRAAPASLTVSADNKSISYGASTPTFTVTYHGFVGKDGAGSLGGTLGFRFSGTGGTSYGPSSTPPTAVGTYTIVPGGYSSDNYDIAYEAGTYTIRKANETINVTTPAPSTAQFGTSFTVVATGGGSTSPLVYGSSGGCTNSGPLYTMTSGTDTCTVTIDQAGDGNYNNAPEVTESVLATQAPQSISFTTTAPSQPVYGDTYVPAATGGGSGNPVLLSASGACSYSQGTVTMTSSGVCTVAANQHGDPDYQDAPENDQRFIVGLKPATLGFTGSPFWSTGSASATSASVTLSGSVTPSAGGVIDLTQAPVTFLLYSSGNTAMTTPDATCTATVSSSGQATCGTSLTPDNWTVVMRMPVNSYFSASDSAPAIITVFVPGGTGSGTGSGWIVDPSYQNLPVAIDPAHNHGTLSFSVSYKKGTTTPTGQAQYAFQGTNGDIYTIKSSSFAGGGLALGTHTVAFGGTCSVTVTNAKTGRVVTSLGGTNYTYRIDATDGTPDRFAISVYRPDGTLYHQAGAPSSQIPLGGGQEVVRSS